MEQQTLIEWNSYHAIKVSESLPEEDEAVFFKADSGEIKKGTYYGEGFWMNSEENELCGATEWHPVIVDI